MGAGHSDVVVLPVGGNVGAAEILCVVHCRDHGGELPFYMHCGAMADEEYLMCR